MIFEVPSALRSHIVSMCPNGIVVFTDVPEMYRADAEELQKKWAEACFHQHKTEDELLLALK